MRFLAAATGPLRSTSAVAAVKVLAAVRCCFLVMLREIAMLIRERSGCAFGSWLVKDTSNQSFTRCKIMAGSKEVKI